MDVGAISSVEIGGSVIFGGEADGSGLLTLGGLGPLDRPDAPPAANCLR